MTKHIHIHIGGRKAKDARKALDGNVKYFTNKEAWIAFAKSLYKNVQFDKSDKNRIRAREGGRMIGLWVNPMREGKVELPPSAN
jgi:hypothetical protein